MTVQGITFHKMTGSGNDFVFVDGRVVPLSFWTEDRIRDVCTRRIGAGADGFVLLEPGSGAAHVRFHFYNSDGRRAEMCGNASLCATRLAARIGLAPSGGLTLETDAGAFHTRCLDGPGERAELQLPPTGDLQTPEIETNPAERGIFRAVVGVPHLIVLTDDVDDSAVAPENRGMALRGHEALGAEGANVNFVSGTGETWRMRTYERGVEAETLACGTGAVAAALALGKTGRAQLPVRITTASGCVLEVDGELAGDRLQRPTLAGEGRLVYTGVLGY